MTLTAAFMLLVSSACFFAGCPAATADAAQSLVGAPSHAQDYPFDEKLEGPVSLYGEALLQVSKQWPKGRRFCHYESEPLKIQMIRVPTPKRRYYIGFKKCMAIKAPFATVAKVIEDFKHYQDLFPGDKTVEIAAQDRNKTTLAWERKIPVFFVPNVKYQMNHLSSAPGPGIKMYRAQLKQGDRLLFSDALVVIESLGPNLTSYSDYEFYEANYGLGLFGINALTSDDVWKESLKGSYLSLLALRSKSENPKLGYDRITTASEAAFKSIDLEKIATGNFED